MIVTFRTEAHADILMFGDIAVQLLKLMGHSGTVPGALLAEDVPAALERLQAALAVQPEAPPEKPDRVDDDDDDNDESECPVPFAHRALPLIELLAAAATAHCNVMWDR